MGSRAVHVLDIISGRNQLRGTSMLYLPPTRLTCHRAVDLIREQASSGVCWTVVS